MNCPNCDFQIDEKNRYCPNCGQNQKSRIVSFSGLISDFLDSVLNFDTKFFETLKVLLISPGKITNHYLEDKRARYVSPGRLYVVASVILFFIIGFTTRNSMGDQSDQGLFKVTSTDSINLNLPDTVIATASDTLSLNLGGMNNFSINDLMKIKDFSDVQMDSFVRSNELGTSAFNKLFIKQLAIVGTSSRGYLFQRFLKSFSITMFFLMPIFALILALFYVRHRRYYVEHLIYSVHFHAVLFLMLSIVFGVVQFTLPDWGFTACFIIPNLYLYLTLKNVYKNGWIKTLIKYALILLVYSLVQFFVILVSMFITVLLF